MIFLLLVAVVFLTTVVILARAATRPLTAVDISLAALDQSGPGPRDPAPAVANQASASA